MPLGEPSLQSVENYQIPRDGGQPPVPGAGMVPGQPAFLPDSRGAPVYVQTPEEMEFDRRTLRRASLMVLSLIPLFGMLFFVLFTFSPVCSMNYYVLIIALVVPFVAIALWTYNASTKVRPWKMYEDGIAFTTYPVLADKYYPYTTIHQIKEVSDNISGNMVTVRWPTQDGINLNMGFQRTPEILAFLRRKMGGPAQPGPEAAGRPLQQLEAVVSGPAPTTFAPERFKHEKTFYAGGLIVALVISALFLYMVPESVRGKYWFLPLALFPTMAVNCLAMTTMVMELYVRARKLPVKFDIRIIGSLLLVLNLLVVAELAVADPIDAALDDHTIELVSTPAPAAGAVLPDTVSDQVLELNESLLVVPRRTLTLENCTVRFHCTTPRQYSLWVAEEGRLEARNCSFSAVSAGNGFGCEFHGAASLVNCTFDGLWGDLERLNGDGGVEIWNDNVSLVGCRISNAATNGLFIVHCDPIITDTVLVQCDDEDVEIHRSKTVFTNCTFSEAGWGIIAWDGCDLRLEGCRFSDINETGLDIVESRCSVQNCTFVDIGGSAIRVHRSELVSYEGTTFAEVGTRIEEDDGFGLNLLSCLGMNVMLSVLTIVNVLLSGRRRTVVHR